MATSVETLENLKRRVTLDIVWDNVEAEVEKRLRTRAKTFKMPGFRPGKVPLKMVAAQYGFEVKNDVLNEQLGKAFYAAARENNLRVAGQPTIEPKNIELKKITEVTNDNVHANTNSVTNDVHDESVVASSDANNVLLFDATFEVYPDVHIGDLSTLTLEKIVTNVEEADIERTLLSLQKQRTHYHLKEQAADNGDRVMVDFVGTLDGQAQEGASGKDFVFVLGDGKLLPEFETAIIGHTSGESITHDIRYPENHSDQEVAGKTITFNITLKRVESAHLPALDETFIRSLGIADGDIVTLRSSIKDLLDHEASARVKAHNKMRVMEALPMISTLEVPNALILQELRRLEQNFREECRRENVPIKNVIPFDILERLNKSAERRVRLGLIVADIINKHDLQASPDELFAQLQVLSKHYESPMEAIKHYMSDRRHMTELEAIVLEQKAVDYVFSQAKVAEKTIPFSQIMSAQ